MDLLLSVNSNYLLQATEPAILVPYHKELLTAITGPVPFLALTHTFSLSTLA
jgi:hypothetical protein